MAAPTPPYRIVTERLVIRCWNPEDGPALQAAVAASLDHLRPFIPWAAREPQSLDERVSLLRRMRADFDLDQDFDYGIFDAGGGQVVGGTGLHPRIGEEGLEIGYWVHVGHTGRGYATEVAGALTRIGFELVELARMEIRCAALNTRSAAVPRRLGYGLHRTVHDGGVLGDGTLAEQQVWTLFARDYPATAAARTRAAAFDAAGRRVL